MADKKVKKTKVVKQKQSQRQTVNVNINTDKRTKKRRTTKRGSTTIVPRLSAMPTSTNVTVHNNLAELAGLLQSMQPQNINYNPEPQASVAHASVAQASNPILVQAPVKPLKVKTTKVPIHRTPSVSSSISSYGTPDNSSSSASSYASYDSVVSSLTSPVNIQPKKRVEKSPIEDYSPVSTFPTLLGIDEASGIINTNIKSYIARKKMKEQRAKKESLGFRDYTLENAIRNLNLTPAKEKPQKDLYKQVVKDATKMGKVYLEKGAKALTAKGTFDQRIVNKGAPKKNP